MKTSLPEHLEALILTHVNDYYMGFLDAFQNDPSQNISGQYLGHLENLFDELVDLKKYYEAGKVGKAELRFKSAFKYYYQSKLLLESAIEEYFELFNENPDLIEGSLDIANSHYETLG